MIQRRVYLVGRKGEVSGARERKTSDKKEGIRQKGREGEKSGGGK